MTDIPAEEDPFAESRMTLGEHLDELRIRLFKGLIAVVVIFVVAYAFRDPITKVVQAPYTGAMEKLEDFFQAQADQKIEAGGDPYKYYLNPADPNDRRLNGFSTRPTAIGAAEFFTVQLKICLYVALFLGSPVLLWQLWQFIAAGLYEKERKAVRLCFPLSMSLFVAGVVFGFYLLVPYAIYFLNTGDLDLVEVQVTLDDYLVFLRSLCLALGLIFQLPLIMSFLGWAGIVLPGTMARYRGHFALSSFIFAAILTPPDPITQSMLAVPMVVLYEVGIWSARFLSKRARAKEARATA